MAEAKPFGSDCEAELLAANELARELRDLIKKHAYCRRKGDDGSRWDCVADELEVQVPGFVKDFFCKYLNPKIDTPEERDAASEAITNVIMALLATSGLPAWAVELIRSYIYQLVKAAVCYAASHLNTYCIGVEPPQTGQLPELPPWGGLDHTSRCV